MNTPKIFVSYSWTNKDHEKWVVNLAERLMSDGVDIIIDKWELKEGHDKYKFMESMVKSEDIDKVLLIIDKKYADKADGREGGVGAEAQIITPAIYSNTAQEKFIPIVTEKNEDGDAYLPVFLKGRIYIDFSEVANFENSYEDLLRNLHSRPAYRKPKVGKPPSYLFEETPMNNKTSFILRGFDSKIEKNPKLINSICRDFLDEVYENLKVHTLKSWNQDIITFGKEICDSINLYTPLRDDFIEFFNKVVRNEYNLDTSNIIHFFEKLPRLTYPQDDRTQWNSMEFENIRFYKHEMFLYLITIGLKNDNYNFVDELLNGSYFFYDKYNKNQQPKSFDLLYHHTDIIKEYYIRTYSKNLYSPMADLMITRIPTGFTKSELIDADYVCHYLAKLNGGNWFPLTYVYSGNDILRLFDRMISMKHFQKIKVLFDVSTPEELKAKLLKIKENDVNPRPVHYQGSYKAVPPIYDVIEIDTIASKK